MPVHGRSVDVVGRARLSGASCGAAAVSSSCCLLVLVGVFEWLCAGVLSLSDSSAAIWPSAPLPPLLLFRCPPLVGPPMGKGAGKGGSLANAGGCCSEPCCKSFPDPTPCGTCYWGKRRAASSPPSSSQSSGSSAAAPRIATCAAASATRRSSEATSN